MAGGSFTAFADEKGARQFLEDVLGRPDCPYCQSQRIVRVVGKSVPAGRYRCAVCRSRFTAMDSNPFDEGVAPLHKWLRATYATDGGSISTNPARVAPIAGVSLSTATKMLHLIRAAATAPKTSSRRRMVRSIVRALNAAVADDDPGSR
ncbi:MAG: hypothetical protein JSS04_00600 [Proteobacteria bacterium]|nr:hypothetical protein [Pseudomonadota bacterium]